MAGIRIDDLPLVTEIQNADNFVVTRDNKTNRTTGLNLLRALSGVRGVENATQNGVPVYKGSIDAAYGTVAQFNSLSAGKGLKLTTTSSVIGFSVDTQKIDTDLIQDEAVTTEKLALTSVTVDKINYSGAILQIKEYQNNLLMGSNVAAPTWAETGAFVNINPIRQNSKFMIEVSTILGAYNQFPYLNIFREVNGQNTSLVQITSAGQAHPAWALGGFQADYHWAYTSNMVTFKVFDQPNTTSPVKYKLMISGSGGGGLWSYIGGSWWWVAYVTTPRADKLRHTPTTMTVFEIQS